VPLAASTQWEIVEGAALPLGPVFDELIRQAAQGEVLFNDDTTVKILERMGARAKQRALQAAERDGNGAQDSPSRTGCSPKADAVPARRRSAPGQQHHRTRVQEHSVL
jgi:hypothetical protein